MNNKIISSFHISKPNFTQRPSLNQEIGDYILKHTIGEGAFSKVKLAVHKPSNNIVAIKILDKTKISKSDQIRTVREMKILTSLNHPNIIQVSTIFENSQNYYIVMEYCPEGELFNYIVHKKRLSEEESSFIFYQIINGLDYIHSHNISHRDLKPENILLLSNRLIKIIDFGLSNFYSDPNNTLTTPCGSPCYAAPEMLRNKAYDGKAVDIWSTGIIVYAMICGYLPFEDKNNQRLFQKILKSTITYPKYVSIAAKRIINKMLTKEPKKRITIEDIKKDAFYLQGKNIYNIKFNTTYEDLHTLQSSSTTVPPISSRDSCKYNTIRHSNDSINLDEDFDIENDLYSKAVMQTTEIKAPPISKLINYSAPRTIEEEEKVIKVNLRFPQKQKVSNFTFKSPNKANEKPHVSLMNYSMFKHKISLTKKLHSSIDKHNMTIYSYRKDQGFTVGESTIHERCITSVEDEKNSKKYTQNIKVPMSSFRRRRINQSIDHDSIIEKFHKKYNLRINYPVLNSNLNSSNKKKRVITYEKKDQKQEKGVIKRNVDTVKHRKMNTMINIPVNNNVTITPIKKTVLNKKYNKITTNTKCVVFERMNTHSNSKNTVIKIR